MKPMPPLVSDDHSRGPVDAPLVIVQYGDYDCPHTRASSSIVRALEGEAGVPVRFVFRHFPLRHLHANAQILSEIAEAAGTLGFFWEVHDRLMGHRRRVDQQAAFDDLRAAHVDVDALRRLLGSAAIEERIERDVKGGRSAGVHSTPTWFFNGALWDGHYDGDTLARQARAALA
jgi:Na+:H+ antiporter, NhaA family